MPLRDGRALVPNSSRGRQTNTASVSRGDILEINCRKQYGGKFIQKSRTVNSLNFLMLPVCLSFSLPNCNTQRNATKLPNFIQSVKQQNRTDFIMPTGYSHGLFFPVLKYIFSCPADLRVEEPGVIVFWFSVLIL